jgi:hypothetical protein
MHVRKMLYDREVSQNIDRSQKTNVYRVTPGKMWALHEEYAQNHQQSAKSEIYSAN